jgi:hypothetical protein
LRSIPHGALIAVRVITSGRILVSLVGARQLKEPRAGSKPLFRGVAQDKLAFRVTAPEADDYLLVLSNRTCRYRGRSSRGAPRTQARRKIRNRSSR